MDVLRGPGEPLTGPVREDMEGRLGASLSDVRIHTDSTAHQAAEAVSARAFTTGSHIAFQRGQYDPASGAGRQTLAHELAHVLQQRSGVVAGTDAGDGIRVSHPSDRFERAAEATAQRAMASHARPAAPAVRTDGGAAQPVTPMGEAVPVQRKVGFEFELIDDKSNVSTVLPGGGLKKKDDSKAALKYLNNAGGFSNNRTQKAYLAADNGNVEYITDPLNDRDEVKSAVGAIAKFHERVGTRGRSERITNAHGGGTYQVDIDGGPPPARPQATIGVRVADILALFAQLNKWYAEEAPRPSRQRSRSIGKRAKAEDTARQEREAKRAELATLRQRVADQASINTDLAVERAKLIVSKMSPNPATSRTAKANVAKEALGFIAIILKTAIDVGNNGGEPDDPKYYLSLMPRTDFVSMLHSLGPTTQQWLRTKLITAIRRVRGGAEFLDSGILATYKEDSGNNYTGPALTGEAWLKSILEGAQGDKDRLSPPPGYESHADRIADGRDPEGIGAKETDGPLSLFEFRGFTAGGAGNKLAPLPVTSWLTLALVVCDLVAEVTGDQQFAPDASEIGYESESEDESESESDEESEDEVPQVVTRAGSRRKRKGT